mmetsp:Transcript_13976/g.30594  ORF Transcript_13976/g.30594 Transcript_13976/m.30594 type:complete len:449 (-) Transcript_13976:117-1463(-)
MRPKNLLMVLCLLRSNVAALAVPQRRVGTSAVNTRARSCRRRNISIFKHFANEIHGDPDDVDSSTALCATRYRERSTKGGEMIESGHIAYRLARRTDIPQIQEVNLATLPENYNANFYLNHMRLWPELTLVAEHVPDGLELESDEPKAGITPLSDFIRNRPYQDGQPRREIVGYVLGKVEERRVDPRRSSKVPMYDAMGYMNVNSKEYENVGHVTSLAVHRHARRLGIATSLMAQLHYHLESVHSTKSVGLHVRMSNKAAVRLYCDEGYDVADIIPRYYGDGEDAYFMQKDLCKVGNVGPEINTRSQKQQPRRYRRGEREREEMLNRDATKGSYFSNRPSLRDSMSREGEKWIGGDSNLPRSRGVALESTSTPTSGNFRQSLRTFFNGSEPNSSDGLDRSWRRQIPPWECGPAELMLPRYHRVFREDAAAAIDDEDGILLDRVAYGAT